MWTIPCHGRSGGIVGMHYFSQVSWPVSLSIFSLLPNHLHNGWMWPLHQPIHLGVVRHSPQFPHAKEVTHLINDAAHKVHTLITQEPCRVPKDQDVTLIQELGDCFSSLIWGYIHLTCFVKWSWNTRTLMTSGSLFHLHGHLYASKVYMQKVQWSGILNQV